MGLKWKYSHMVTVLAKTRSGRRWFILWCLIEVGESHIQCYIVTTTISGSNDLGRHRAVAPVGCRFGTTYLNL